MIVLLKIILGLFLLLDIVVSRILFLDFRRTIKSGNYEESSVAERIKLKFIFYFTFIALISFGLLMGFFVIIPITVG